MPETTTITAYAEAFKEIGIAGMILIFLGYIAIKLINIYMPPIVAAKVKQTEADTDLARTAKDAIAKMPTTIAEAIGSFNGKLTATEVEIKKHVDGHVKELVDAIENKREQERLKAEADLAARIKLLEEERPRERMPSQHEVPISRRGGG